MARHPQVANESSDWEVITRYSAMQKLVIDLKALGIETAPLPRKRMTSSKSEEAIQERAKALDALLVQLTHSHSAEPIVRGFLGLDEEHAPRDESPQPQP